MLRLGLAASIALSLTLLAAAQTAEQQPAAEAPPKPAKSKGPRVPSQVTLINNAAMLLAGVEIATKEKEPRIVGALSQGLQPGKSVKLRLKNPKGCDYSVVAVFEDGSEGGIASVNLCKDPLLRFTGGG